MSVQHVSKFARWHGVILQLGWYSNSGHVRLSTCLVAHMLTLLTLLILTLQMVLCISAILNHQLCLPCCQADQSKAVLPMWLTVGLKDLMSCVGSMQNISSPSCTLQGTYEGADQKYVMLIVNSFAASSRFCMQVPACLCRPRLSAPCLRRSMGVLQPVTHPAPFPLLSGRGLLS